MPVANEAAFYHQRLGQLAAIVPITAMNFVAGSCRA